MRVVPALGRLAFVGFVLAFVLGATASLGTRFGLFSLDFGTGVLLPWTVYLALASLALGLAWAVLGVFLHEGGKTRHGLTALIGSAAILALPLYQYYDIQISPPLHDISTDLANPPQFQSVLALRKGATNPPDFNPDARVTWHGTTRSAGEWQRKYYADIFTLRLLMPPAKLYQRALHTAEDMGWTIVSQNPEEGRIEATDTSFFFGLTDDIVIRVRPSGAGAKVDIRSESRNGLADGGRNANAIRDYLRTLKRM